MRKGRDGGKKKEKKEEKIDGNSGHYVIACSRRPERRHLERRTLVLICFIYNCWLQTVKYSNSLIILGLVVFFRIYITNIFTLHNMNLSKRLSIILWLSFKRISFLQAKGMIEFLVPTWISWILSSKLN